MLLVLSCIVALSATTLNLWIVRVVLTLIPIFLMLVEKHYTFAIRFTVFYGVALYLTYYLHSVQATGVWASILHGYASFVAQFMPAMIMAWYLVHTTKMDEFISAMQKMHVPDKITIPMAVVMRFFPTLREEYASIRDAMKMRGIMLGGGNPAKMIEYRMVPLLFSCVNIGDELSAAAVTRGLSTMNKRSSIVVPKMRVPDYLFMAFYTAMLILFLVLKYA